MNAFRARRRRIWEKIGEGAMLLPAAPIRYRSGDSEYRYCPDPALYYATGWEEPGAIACLRGGKEPEFVLFIPKRDAERERWTGPGFGLDEAKERAGASEAFALEEFRARAPRLLRGRTLHYRLGASALCDDVARRAMKGRPASLGGPAPQTVADPGLVLGPMRRVKDACEIEALRMAARITARSFKEALAKLRPGVGEWEIEAELEYGFRRRGGQGPAFATIVAGGEAACILHYTRNDQRLEAGQMALIDAGAQYRWYAGDVTRVLPVGGSPSAAQREVYQTVARALQAGVRACAPGRAHEGIERAVQETLAEGLCELGVIEGDADERAQGGARRRYCPHRASHWLGLETHDPSPYVEGGRSVKLAPGMALTVEPGLYFPKGSCPQRPELEGLGVRLEDDILIGERRAEVLSSELPTSLDELCARIRA